VAEWRLLSDLSTVIFDSNRDGIGVPDGITAKLDYLN
jgi:hypothetical protein